MGLADALMVPVVIIFYLAIDYAFWPVFFMMAGYWAVAYMLAIVAGEFLSLAAMIRGIGGN